MIGEYIILTSVFRVIKRSHTDMDARDRLHIARRIASRIDKAPATSEIELWLNHMIAEEVDLLTLARNDLTQCFEAVDEPLAQDDWMRKVELASIGNPKKMALAQALHKHTEKSGTAKGLVSIVNAGNIKPLAHFWTAALLARTLSSTGNENDKEMRARIEAELARRFNHKIEKVQRWPEWGAAKLMKQMKAQGLDTKIVVENCSSCLQNWVHAFK